MYSIIIYNIKQTVTCYRYSRITLVPILDYKNKTKLIRLVHIFFCVFKNSLGAFLRFLVHFCFVLSTFFYSIIELQNLFFFFLKQNHLSVASF